MTSWVLSIDRKYPQHWEIAKEQLYWDTRNRRTVEPGDLVYFWVPDVGIVGRAEVADQPRQLSADEALPWLNRADVRYGWRIPFVRAEDSSRGRMRWSHLMQMTGIPQNPMIGHSAPNPELSRSSRG